MSLPGPTVGAWALGLLLWGAAAAVLGEAIRIGAARYIPSWRSDEPIQRGVLDFYLGGGVLYLLAAVPLGLFVAPLIDALPIAAAIGLLVLAVRTRRAGRATPLLPMFRRFREPAYLLVIASAAGLFAFEVALAGPIPTGNTFDSGLLTTYTSILLRTHTIARSFAPYASTSILYPQGAPVWLGWAQTSLALPPARTALLVTPLFMALAPLGGFVFGRRWFGSDRAGAAIALMLAWLAPTTRSMVAGSNDFVFAFPLVLWLAAEAARWIGTSPPRVPDAVGFGLLAGYSAAMNPVGAEWLFPALLIGGLLATPAWGGRALAWLGRWALALGAALLAVLPSLVILVEGLASPGFVPGAASPPPNRPTGIGTPGFLGSIDPYLFRSEDIQLSIVPALRAELAVLLTAGVVLLLLFGRGSGLGRYLAPFRTFALGAFLALVGLLGVLWWASTGFGPAVAFEDLTSAGELSLWLFTVYVLIASLPLVLAFEFLAQSRDARALAPSATAAPPASARRARSRAELAHTLVPLAVALVIVVPGVTLTPSNLAPVLTHLYHDFGNVSADDFALLEYAGAHLPAGARVLIAPGSAADFLPGYASDVVLLYPLLPDWPWVNASYTLLREELSNATLTSAGYAAMAALEVGYVIVTGNSTVLWPAFSPAPLLADPGTFPVLFHAGDAYLFART